MREINRFFKPKKYEYKPGKIKKNLNSKNDLKSCLGTINQKL